MLCLSKNGADTRCPAPVRGRNTAETPAAVSRQYVSEISSLIPSTKIQKISDIQALVRFFFSTPCIFFVDNSLKISDGRGMLPISGRGKATRAAGGMLPFSEARPATEGLPNRRRRTQRAGGARRARARPHGTDPHGGRRARKGAGTTTRPPTEPKAGRHKQKTTPYIKKNLE